MNSQSAPLLTIIAGSNGSGKSTLDNNRHTWEGLEVYCRQLGKQGKELYIIAGTYGSQGQ